ncbi:CAP domain-containing protein [Lentibacillus sp. Marseille-P4043]|uniref:CAP domain-containing protein n=1 Tax=Lentibacillus sp. Marseille-P4043 TaxID=2040293 RepID=UPI000D0B446C|nr:CAP domain-containing protein [Lentibacillus sp. Marseille-P4043]
MFKKIGVVTALSTALLFGGSLSSVDASASTDHSQGQQYKVYYSVNGGHWNSFSQDDFSNLLSNYFKKHHINWDWNNKKATHAENKHDVKQSEKAQEQPKKTEEQSKQTQEQSKQEQPEKTQKQPEKTNSQAQQSGANKQEQHNQSQSQLPQLSQYEQQVVDLTNDERAKQGLSPLKADLELSRVAREKSRDMQANGYFDHNSPTYGSPFDMMKSYGISYRTAGENIARGQRTPEEVVNAWMNSEGHRANILNPDFTHIGVGYAADGDYWTQQFIGK